MHPKTPIDKPLDAIEEAIFNSASDLVDSAERVTFLDRACANDSDLRSRIETLLRADQQAAEFFAADPLNLEQTPARKSNDVAPDPTEPATGTIGRYKLLQKIGEGGMGVVYMAEQQEPVRRRVALKIIKLGMDTRAVVARFEAERQALALMDHPNIARILDGGATETGSPYFVMELVQGVPLTEYCDKAQLTIPARIGLFIQVCEAVQSAHQKGVIHRDLKPSNVMVTLHDGVPVPKVIDFGVAKATNQKLTEKTLFTNYATLIGTPAYMSPEQAEMSGLDVDTRSDIYSFGVLLYELLTGTTPFPEQRLRSVGYGEMQKIIAQEEPQRLPTRLSTMEGAARTVVAKNRSAAPADLGNRLKGDLDSIVMKCLEKDRTWRYETASSIAADVRRHLNNEPVLARPPSTIYKIQKFARRNKAAVAVTSLMILGVIAFLVLGTISYQRERVARTQIEASQRGEISERKRAQTEAANAEQQALRAAQFQYASDMNLAHQAVAEGNLFRALQLLDRHRPGSSPAPRDDEAQTASHKNNQRLVTSAATNDLRGWEWRYLWNQCQSEEILTLGYHSNGVTTVGFTPDGKTAFSGGNDRVLRFWDMMSKHEIGSIPQPQGVTGAAFSPDGRWLASTTEEFLTIREWPSQMVKSVITNSWSRPNTLAFSPDSRLLAYGDMNNGISVWDLTAAREIAHIAATFGWIASQGLSFSPDGQTVAYAETEIGDIALWNLREHSVIRRWKAHSWYITRIFFSADGKQLISGSADRTVKIWDLATLREVKTLDYPLGFGPSRVSSPRLSIDGTMLASAASGGGVAITIQEIPSGREIIRLRGNREMVSDGAFSPDGKTFISGCADGTVRLWDLTARPKDSDIRAFPLDTELTSGITIGFSLSPDGHHLISAFTNGTFSIREIPSLREGPRFLIPVDKLASLTVATGGQLAAFVANDGQVVFWHADTGETNCLRQPIGKESKRAAFSLDGKRFAAGTWNEINVCDLLGGTVRRFPVADPSALFYLAFSSDAQKLMAGYARGLVKVWDFAKANPESTLLGHDYQVNGMALLPGEKTLVSVSRQIRFWDLKTAKTTSILQPRSAVFRTVAVSPDGRRLAVGAADGFITIWDLASMEEVVTLAGHKRPIEDLRFLSDGDTLVSVSVDEVRVWRAASLREADGQTHR